MPLNRTPLHSARDQRSRRNWFALVFVLIGLVPTTAAIASNVFPGVSPALVFGAGVGISSGVACFIHLWRSRRNGFPRCPRCGAELLIIESGPRKNVDILDKEGTCPACGETLE